MSACSLLVGDPEGQAPKCGDTWARSLGGLTDEDELAGGVAIDAACNVIVCGSFRGNMSIPVAVDGTGDAELLQGEGSQDAFVAKFDASGDLVWARSWGGLLRDSCDDVALGPNGDTAVVVGSFMDPVTGNELGIELEPVVEISTSGDVGDLYAARIALSDPPSLMWSTALGSARPDTAETVSVDSEGDAWMAAFALGEIVSSDRDMNLDFTSAHGRTQGATLIHLDEAGDVVWGAHLQDTDTEDAHIHSIDFDSAGNAIVTATGHGNGFDSGACEDPLYSPGSVNPSAFIASIDRVTSTCNWFRAWGSVGVDDANSVAVDRAGVDDIFVAGAINASGVVDFGGGAILDPAGVGGVDAFAAAFDVDGGETWLRIVGSAETDAFHLVSIDPVSDNVFLFGDYSAPAFIGRSSSIVDDEDFLLDPDASVLPDLMIAQYDRDGAFIAGQSVGGLGSEVLAGAALGQESIVLFGHFDGTFETDEGTLGQADKVDSDVFIVVLPRD